MRAAAIEGVMLWVSRDDGGTWVPYPKIHHGAGPIRYEAPEDGHYGFHLVVFIANRCILAVAVNTVGRKDIIEYAEAADSQLPRCQVVGPEGFPIACSDVRLVF